MAALPTPHDDLKDLSNLATWRVSSHKFGFGVDKLRDDNPEVFWQSEGPQPHHIYLHFPSQVPLLQLSLLLSHPKDDSYTPQSICIKAGTGLADLQEVKTYECDKPDGWVIVDLREGVEDPNIESDQGHPIHAHLLQVTILSNHLNGKDTHVRGLRVFGPPAQRLQPTMDDDEDALDHPFTSLDYRMLAAIR